MNLFYRPHIRLLVASVTSEWPFPFTQAVKYVHKFGILELTKLGDFRGATVLIPTAHQARLMTR